MLYPSNSNETLRIAKQVSSYLSGAGWQVDRVDKNQNDTLIAIKKNLKFRIVCIDDAVSNFSSPSKIVERLEEYSGIHRTRSVQIVIYVTKRRILGLADDTLVDKGVVLLTVDELSTLKNLESFCERNPEQMDRRALLLLRGCPALCISLSEKYCTGGDFERAVYWLEETISWLHSTHQAHHKLIDLYVRGHFGINAERVPGGVGWPSQM